MLDPFEPADLPSIYYVRGKRIRVTPGEKVNWPYNLTAEERALGLSGIRQKYSGSVLSELGDVTDPNWPPPEVLRKYDHMNRLDFWRHRGASPEAMVLLSLGGIDDRFDTRSALMMLRNQALNRKAQALLQDQGRKRSSPESLRYALVG